MCKYMQGLQKERYPSWKRSPTRPGVQPRGILAQPPSRAQRGPSRGDAWAWLPGAGCPGLLHCRLQGTQPRCPVCGLVIYVTGQEEQGLSVPSWSLGGAGGGVGNEVGMWQEGGNSWLPGAWYRGRQIFMPIKRAFSSGPAAAGGCPGGGQGPTQTASRERGLCGKWATAAQLEGGGQRCRAGEVAGKCCFQLAWSCGDSVQSTLQEVGAFGLQSTPSLLLLLLLFKSFFF